jgi:hypothetical protein
VTRRVAFRAAGLALLLGAIVVGLTVYFSTQKIPPCLVTDVPKWHAPTDRALHRFELVVPDRTLCFFDQDHDNELIGYVKLPGIEGITAIAPRDGQLALRYGDGRGALVDLSTGHIRYGVKPPPPPSDRVVVPNSPLHLEYETRRDLLGVRVLSLPSRKLREVVTFEGFAWNPRFGPNPPDHGVSLAPDRAELWVVDAPNGVIHVFDVSAATPRSVANLRLTKPLSGDENPCASRRCERLGWLQHSADGRYVYVGDAGDVFDATKREQVANLEALHQSRLLLEVDWVDGKPQFPAGVR